MSRTRLDPDVQLEESLRRIRGALARNRYNYASMVGQIMEDTNAEVAERATARLAERHARRMERWRLRDERRREWSRHPTADVPRGIVSLIAAGACLAFAIFRPELWWLIFVAFGFGTSAASAFGHTARGRRAQRETEADRREEMRGAEASGAGTVEHDSTAETGPPDPKVARIQSLCDRLLSELEAGPPIVREVMTQPQATIGGLRQACLEIARREGELRTVLTSQEEAALLAERSDLLTRLADEQDAIVRERLGQALRALEQQLAHRKELATAAARLDAENTRILYTLESLHMQLLRARSTDVGAPELGGKLRESLRELGTEIDAVAEALEWASAPSAPDSATSAPRTSESDQAAADTDRAEKLAAARRAAQARETQRR